MRECGTCSACCRWPAIPELEKPAGTACSRLAECGYGCTQYEKRPADCSTYKCSWLEGYGAPSDRPDDSGIAIDRRQTPFGPLLVARDLGITDAGRKRRTIKRISRDLDMVCVVVDEDENITHVRGPKARVDKLIRKHPVLAKFA